MSQPDKQNLYRKYRPQTFSELLGQDHIVKTLQAAISQGKVSHAYLFSGPRGTGKTSAARLLAKMLNCQNPVSGTSGQKDACRLCDNCRQIEEFRFMDIAEIDAASNNSVDDIRDMREKVKYLPVEGHYKVYIIDEVHMLSGAAFNAFLITLEEPPPKVVFVLATTDPQKVPATIISRCQCFDFHSISRKVLMERLAEVVKREREPEGSLFPMVGEEVLQIISETAAGGFRDALGLLDQVASGHSGGEVSVEEVLGIVRRVGHATLKKLGENLFAQNAIGILQDLDGLFSRGYEPGSVGRDLLEWLRRCVFLKLDSQANQVLELPAEQAREIGTLVAVVPADFLIAATMHLERTLTGLRRSVNPRILFEIELLRLARREVSLGNEGLERRISQVEDQVRNPRFSRVEVPRSIAPIATTRSVEALGKPNLSVVRSAPPTSVASVQPLRKSASPEEQFQTFRQKFSQENPKNAFFLASARLGEVKEGKIRVILENEFGVKRFQDAEMISLIQNLVDQLYGKGFRMDFQLPGVPSRNIPPAENQSQFKESIAKIDQAARQKIVSQPAVSEAIAVFGGEVAGIEKK